jgi:hypothetical protein
MRISFVLAAVVAVAAVGLISLAKSEAILGPGTTVSFAERWAPVDEALQSGRFAAKDSYDR